MVVLVGLVGLEEGLVGGVTFSLSSSLLLLSLGDFFGYGSARALVEELPEVRAARGIVGDQIGLE